VLSLCNPLNPQLPLNPLENSKFEIRNSKMPPRFLFAAGALLCALSFLFDNRLIAWIAAHPSRFVKHLGQFFTYWGDFIPIVTLLLLLLLIAWLLKRPFLTRLLLLMLGSAVASGLAANILRVLTGRARPSARVPPGWYGLKNHGAWIAGGYQYSSFPSAHTAVAIACIVPLWLLLPRRRRLVFALPATLAALCIAASRLFLNAHHLSDVLTAAWLGILISTLLCTRFAPRACRATP
jgi:membrane-associated phospholipid phosphatase